MTTVKTVISDYCKSLILTKFEIVTDKRQAEYYLMKKRFILSSGSRQQGTEKSPRTQSLILTLLLTPG